MRRMSRFLACLLVCVCALGPALAEEVQFRIQADIDPVQWPVEARALMSGLAALADAATVTGSFQVDDERFDLEAALLLPHRDRTQQTSLHLWGIDSHWDVASPLLGDETLMLNNLALAEFGVKAYHHLGVPLQYGALIVPYVHTSALDALSPALSPLFPAEAGTTLLSTDELTDLASGIAARFREDRTLRCWVEALGVASGADQTIFEALDALPDALAALCPNGLTVTKSDGGLRWQATTGEADGPLLLDWTQDGPAAHLNATLPGLGSLVASLRNDVTILTGTIHVESPLLSGEIAFSLPQSLPVTLPFFLTVDLTGQLLGDAPLALVFEGEAHGNTLTIRQLLPDHTRTMMTVTATLTPVDAPPLPEWTAGDIAGVSILSVNGESLSALLGRIREPLVTELFRLVSALPPESCQALMDLLEDSGILGLLTDAMTGGSAGY